MDWRRVVLLACALVLVVMAVVMKLPGRRPARVEAAGSSPHTTSAMEPALSPPAGPSLSRSSTPKPAQARRAERPASAASADALASVTLQATLLAPDFDMGSFEAEARIGIAVIGDEDLGEMLTWIEDGKEGAGPTSATELANVRHWIPAKVQADERGGGILGPVEVPAAFAYRILAWLGDGSFYWKEYQPRDDGSTSGPRDAGEIAVTKPTGLYLRVVNNTPNEPTYVAHLTRIVDPADAERASSFLPVVEHAAPRLADALLDGDSLLVPADTATRLAPLVPDFGLTITLATAAGVRAKPLFVPLQEGVVKTVDLDVGRLFERASTDTLRLVGTLYAGQTSSPLAGIVLEREGAEQAGTQVTAADGGFVFQGIPRGQLSRFIARSADTSGSRPLGPVQREFVFDPAQCEATSSSGECRVEWSLPVFQWLVADLPEGSREDIAQSCREPYPVYLLQRRGETGQWTDMASDHFLLEENGVAVSVTAGGAYRVGLAYSPVYCVFSDAVQMASEDREKLARFRFPAQSPEARSFRVVSVGGRTPVSGAMVEILGPHSSLPPMSARTSPEGMVEIGPASVERITVTVGLPGSEPISREMPVQPGMEIEI